MAVMAKDCINFERRASSSGFCGKRRYAIIQGTSCDIAAPHTGRKVDLETSTTCWSSVVSAILATGTTGNRNSYKVYCGGTTWSGEFVPYQY
eukprot:1421341-Rhodomonas_salina.1